MISIMRVTNLVCPKCLYQHAEIIKETRKYSEARVCVSTTFQYRCMNHNCIHIFERTTDTPPSSERTHSTPVPNSVKD